MGRMEDQMKNAFNFTGFTGGMGSGIGSKMARDMMLRMNLQTLMNIRKNIDAQIRSIETELKKNAGPFKQAQSDFQSQSGAGSEYSDDMDPFVILNVKSDASKEEVDKAYKAAMHKAHPDKGGSNIDAVKVNAAYETIKIMNDWK